MIAWLDWYFSLFTPGVWIALYLYCLFACWIYHHTVKNYDAIHMFSFKRWILGSSNSSNAFKVLIGASVVFALLMLEGYMDSLRAAL